MLILLFSMLFKLLSGGPSDVFQIPHLEKEIKANVLDDERKDQLLDLVKGAKQQSKDYMKFRSKQVKLMKKYSADRTIASAKMLDLFNSYHSKRLVLQDSMISYRLQFQDLFTDEEWNSVIGKAEFPSGNKVNKQEKAEQKANDAIDKIFSEIDKSIVKNISDTTKRKEVLVSMSGFEAIFYEFNLLGQSMNYTDKEYMKNRTLVKADLDGFYDDQNDLRVKGMDAFLAFRDAGIKNTEEGEWKAIMKELKDLFN
ncbi:MAG: hypothetical protein JXR07_18025 [Reichenbachiella sp.]